MITKKNEGAYGKIKVKYEVWHEVQNRGLAPFSIENSWSFAFFEKKH